MSDSAEWVRSELLKEVSRLQCRMDRYEAVSSAMNTQPSPIQTDERHTVDAVCEDFQTRKQMGIKKYGVALQPSNGRDSLQDAYEEALDLCVYLKNEILLRESLSADLASSHAANKAMQERMDRMEARHKETIAALRRELAGVMPGE